MLRFNLNVSILLKEYPFLERFDQAARLGFDAVEFWWPAGEELTALVQRIRDAGLKTVLFNFDAGNMPMGDRGLLNDPERQEQFRAHVPVALELAQQLGCTRLNALVGRWRDTEVPDAQLARVRENVHWAAEQARAAGVSILVESLNRWENGPYMFTNTAETLSFLDTVEADNLLYQYDVYHMQRMEGNIIPTIRNTISRIGHIQIADAPNRHQPGTGELRYPFILQAIEASGYAGSIGLEYNPRGSSEDSFAWLPADRRGDVELDALRFS